MRLALAARRPAAVIVVVVAAALMVPAPGMVAPAAAQPAGNVDEARAAFRRAGAAEERGDWQTAIDEYRTAYDLAPHPDVLYNIAGAHEHLGQLRQAATYYQRYLDESQAPPDRARVERLIDELRRRPAQVSIASAPAGASVSVDGRDRGKAPVVLRLAGGQHEIVVERDGARATRTVTIEYGEAADLTVAVGGPGTLIVSANENGATITVDDRRVGVTPWQGAVEAGRHKVVIAKEGFTTVTRSVEVPPDGTVQIRAPLGRPLGYVPPPDTSRIASVVAGFDGGTLIGGGERTASVHITIGWRAPSRRWEFDTGLAFGGSGVLGYTIGARGYALTGTVRPYLGIGADLITDATNGRAVGGVMIADLGRGRSRWDVFVEGGAGRLVADGGSRTVGVVLAGMVWHLARPASTR